MTASQEGDFDALAGAGEECGLDLGPVPGQAPTGPSQAPTPVPYPTQVNEVPSQAQDIPALTDDQVAKMNAIISGDPLLTVMLRGGYTINDYGPWVAGDGTFIGAIAEIFLTAPTDYQGSLPMVGFEPAEDGSKEYIYEHSTSRHPVSRVSLFWLTLRKRKWWESKSENRIPSHFPSTDNRRRRRDGVTCER